MFPEGDIFPDLLLHGGGVESAREEETAILECLRWPSVSEYIQLARGEPAADISRQSRCGTRSCVTGTRELT